MPTYRDIYKFEGDTTLQPYGSYTWKSKLFMFGPSKNFQFGRVEATFSSSQIAYAAAVSARDAIISRNAQKISSGLVGGSVGEDVVGEYPVMGDALEAVPSVAAPVDYFLAFRLYSCDNGAEVLRHTVQVFDSKPFTLRGGFRAKRFYVAVTGNIPVKSVAIVEAFDEFSTQ